MTLLSIGRSLAASRFAPETPMGRRLLLPFSLLAAILFLVGLSADVHILRLVTKPVPVIALLLWLWPARGPYRRWVLVGLVCSLAGDLLLEIDRERLFVAGLGAFLLGHLGYTTAYIARERRLRFLRALPFALWCGGLLAWLWPGLGKMAAPVTVYTAVIGTMLWRAAALPQDRLGRLALGGAVLFALSDSLIAINKFGEPFPYARHAIIILYWLGQWGITAAAKRA